MATPLGQIPLRKKCQSNCSEHKGRQLELYCKTCNVLACLQCLSSTHQGHILSELSNITSQKKQDIRNFIDRTEQNDLVQLRKNIHSTDQLLDDNTKTFEKLSNDLKIQTDRLKQELDMLTAQTLSMYQNMMEDNAKLIQKYKQDLKTYEKELKQRVEECKTLLQRGSDIELYDVGCDICYKTSLPVKPALGVASFTPNKNPQCHLELDLGKITMSSQDRASTDQDKSAKTSDGHKPSSVSQPTKRKGKKPVAMYTLLPATKVLGKWNASIYIDSICHTSSNQAWAIYYNTETLNLLGRDGKIIQVVHHKPNIIYISLSPKTDTLWVCDRENNIKEMVSGQLTNRFSTKEEPMCICVTASNHVIVGMPKHISKFTTQGQRLLSTGITATGKPFVCTPNRITECPITHNLAVVDHNYQKYGGDSVRHVLVMDSDFNKLFVYKGDIPSSYQQSSHTGVGSFDPSCVTYDSVGNIIIGDYIGLLLISGRGDFLRIIHKDDNGRPCALGVDREGILWTVFRQCNAELVKLLKYSSM